MHERGICLVAVEMRGVAEGGFLCLTVVSVVSVWYRSEVIAVIAARLLSSSASASWEQLSYRGKIGMTAVIMLAVPAVFARDALRCHAQCTRCVFTKDGREQLQRADT